MLATDPKHHTWPVLLNWIVIYLLVSSIVRIDGSPDAATTTCPDPADDKDENDNDNMAFQDVTIVKIGGSSITHKARFETLNETSLAWFGKTVACQISDYFRAPEAATSCSSTSAASSYSSSCPSGSAPTSSSSSCISSQPPKKKLRRQGFIVVHGAGSFGHHTAKEFGLQGYVPGDDHHRAGEKALDDERDTWLSVTQTMPYDPSDHRNRKRLLQGLARTRQSVQRLNAMVVQTLVENGVNAVALSPCFGTISVLQPPVVPADQESNLVRELQTTVERTIRAGLVPVLHGDACLYAGGGRRSSHQGGAVPVILSGDTLLQWIGTAPWVSRAVFVTDVDGVYTRDPKKGDATSSPARLLREIKVTRGTSSGGDLVVTPVDDADRIEVSGSEHEHDVTGGLKTKLSAAAVIAAAGKNVTIVRCSSNAAEHAIGGMLGPIDLGTIVFSR